MPTKAKGGPASPTAEDHVRAYLTFLSDPTALRDQRAVKRAQAEVAKAVDPIEKVRALTRLERAETVDEVALRTAFVNHVGEWVAESGATATALSSAGVPPDALRAAGLMPRPAAPAKRKNRRALNVDAVCAALDIPATAAELARRFDCDRKVMMAHIGEMVADGRVVKVCPDPMYTGKGRKPMLYQQA